MSKIISIHSYRGGTGKSSTAANLAALLAADGLRIGVIDTHTQSGGIHFLFGLTEGKMPFSLDDYLLGKCSIERIAYEVTPSPRPSGQIFLIRKGEANLVPASVRLGEIARVLRQGYDVGLLHEGLQELVRSLNLDVLLIEAHPGLDEEALLSIAICDTLLILMRPDQQDFQVTGVTIEVARRLEVPNPLLIVNEAPRAFNAEALKAEVETKFECRVGAVLPHSDELMALASSSLFVLRYPNHLLTQRLKQLATAAMQTNATDHDPASP
jgi:MinD-like ATPase involved in chromosome partitioning or flagellar assembly